MHYPRAAARALAPLRGPRLWHGLAALFTLGMVVVVAVALAGLTWQVAAPPTTPPPSQPGTAAPGAAPAARAGDGLAGVAGLHLFGVVAAADRLDRPSPPIDAPETRLRLELKGVIARPTPEAGVAVIADARGRDALYLVGAELPGSAILEQVYADRVILSRGGRYEMLRLPRDATAVSGGSPKAAQAADPAARLGQLREVWRDDPARILDAVQIKSVQRDGVVRGYALTPGSERALFAELGLEPGDIVTAVNGVALDQAGAPQQVLGLLQGASRVTLSVERRGRPRTLELRINP
jgi:general secretion pathway protein C